MKDSWIERYFWIFLFTLMSLNELNLSGFGSVHNKHKDVRSILCVYASWDMLLSENFDGKEPSCYSGFRFSSRFFPTNKWLIFVILLWYFSYASSQSAYNLSCLLELSCNWAETDFQRWSASLENFADIKLTKKSNEGYFEHWEMVLTKIVDA